MPWDDAHVIYVWADALLNYATAVGYNENPEKFESTFPADVHLVGKDILRFHAVIWPAMLMANGLPLPGRIAANGWLLVGGEKMSKSNLTGIKPQDLTSHFGVDAYRWYFLRAIAFGQDGSFSWEDFSARYTSELANDYGNLASRVAAMVGRYFGGTLPASTAHGEAEQTVQEGLARAVAEADRRIGDELDFQGGILAVFDFVKQVNGYLTEQEPWKVARTAFDHAADAAGSPDGRARLATILYTAAESLRAIAVLLAPIMPDTSAKLWDSLGAEASLGRLQDQRIQEAADWGGSPPVRRSPRVRCCSRGWKSRRRLLEDPGARRRRQFVREVLRRRLQTRRERRLPVHRRLDLLRARGVVGGHDVGRGAVDEVAAARDRAGAVAAQQLGRLGAGRELPGVVLGDDLGLGAGVDAVLRRVAVERGRVVEVVVEVDLADAGQGARCTIPFHTLWWMVTRSLPVLSVSLLPISIVLSWLLKTLRSTVTRSEPPVMSRAPSWIWYLRPKYVFSDLSKTGASVNVLWSAQTFVAPRRVTES